MYQSPKKEEYRQCTWEIILFNNSVRSLALSYQKEKNQKQIEKGQNLLHNNRSQSLSLHGIIYVIRFIGIMKNIVKKRRYLKVKKNVEELLKIHVKGGSKKQNFTSEEVQKKRKKLLKDMEIEESILEWWISIKKDVQKKYLSRDRYYQILFLIYENLLINKVNWKTVAQTDWKNDSKGNRFINWTLFKSAIFELADIWSDTLQKEEYIRFLRSLLEKISILAKEKYMKDENFILDVKEIEEIFHNTNKNRMKRQINKELKKKKFNVLKFQEKKNELLFDECIKEIRKENESKKWEVKEMKDLEKSLNDVNININIPENINKVREEYGSLFKRSIKDIMKKVNEKSKKKEIKMEKNILKFLRSDDKSESKILEKAIISDQKLFSLTLQKLRKDESSNKKFTKTEINDFKEGVKKYGYDYVKIRNEYKRLFLKSLDGLEDLTKEFDQLKELDERLKQKNEDEFVNNRKVSKGNKLTSRIQKIINDTEKIFKDDQKDSSEIITTEQFEQLKVDNNLIKSPTENIDADSTSSEFVKDTGEKEKIDHDVEDNTNESDGEKEKIDYSVEDNNEREKIDYNVIKDNTNESDVENNIQTQKIVIEDIVSPENNKDGDENVPEKTIKEVDISSIKDDKNCEIVQKGKSGLDFQLGNEIKKDNNKLENGVRELVDLKNESRISDFKKVNNRVNDLNKKKNIQKIETIDIFDLNKVEKIKIKNPKNVGEKIITGNLNRIERVKNADIRVIIDKKSIDKIEIKKTKKMGENLNRIEDVENVTINKKRVDQMEIKKPSEGVVQNVEVREIIDNQIEIKKKKGEEKDQKNFSRTKSLQRNASFNRSVKNSFKRTKKIVIKKKNSVLKRPKTAKTRKRKGRSSISCWNSKNCFSSKNLSNFFDNQPKKENNASSDVKNKEKGIEITKSDKDFHKLKKRERIQHNKKVDSTLLLVEEEDVSLFLENEKRRNDGCVKKNVKKKKKDKMYKKKSKYIDMLIERKIENKCLDDQSTGKSVESDVKDVDVKTVELKEIKVIKIIKEKINNCDINESSIRSVNNSLKNKDVEENFTLPPITKHEKKDEVIIRSKKNYSLFHKHDKEFKDDSQFFKVKKIKNELSISLNKVKYEKPEFELVNKSPDIFPSLFIQNSLSKRNEMYSDSFDHQHNNINERSLELNLTGKKLIDEIIMNELLLIPPKSKFKTSFSKIIKGKQYPKSSENQFKTGIDLNFLKIRRKKYVLKYVSKTFKPKKSMVFRYFNMKRNSAMFKKYQKYDKKMINKRSLRGKNLCDKIRRRDCISAPITQKRKVFVNFDDIYSNYF